MAKKDVYKYYTQCTDQITQLNKSIQDLREAYGDRPVDKDKLEYLSNLITVMRDNCDRLSYIVFLLNQPRFGIFKRRYDQMNKDLIERFKDLKVTKDDELAKSEDVLNKIREYIEMCKKEIDNE